jgi:hypothetical protein
MRAKKGKKEGQKEISGIKNKLKGITYGGNKKIL